MPQLYCLETEELLNLLKLSKPYHAKIVKSYLDKGVTDFSLMTSLPKEDRERLKKIYPSALSSSVIERMDAPSATKLKSVVLWDANSVQQEKWALAAI